MTRLTKHEGRKFVEVIKAMEPPNGVIQAARKLRLIADVIEMVDNRCMAYDGPVGNTREEMTDAEMRRIYRAALNGLRHLKPLLKGRT